MRIQDLEVKSGLDRATIRYYEKEGMITPVRHENGYRDYSQEDLQTLEKVKLLRQLGMSLDQIRQIQQGSGDLQAAIDAQMPKLTELRDHAQRALQVCQLMLDDHVTYDNLKADYYLEKLKTIAVQYPGVLKAQSKEFREVIWREWHPARRYFARYTDYFLFVLTIFLVQALILKTGVDTLILSPFSFLTMLAFIPIEALCLHFFGATFGKFIYGIQIRDAYGCRLGLSDAFSRAWEVFRYGLGFGIPFWSLWRLYKSYKHYDEYEMDWDCDCEISYTCNRKRVALGIATAIIVASLLIVGAFRITLPKNLNTELSIPQFAENYNYFWKLQGQDPDWGMHSDGKFKKTGPAEDEDGYVIYINGKLVFDHCTYECKDDVIKRITFEEEAIDFFWYDAIPLRGITAAVTLLSAKEGENRDSCLAFHDEIVSNIRSAILGCNQQASFTHGDIKIEWYIEFENATFDGSTISGKDTEDTESYAKVRFVIEVLE